MFFICVFAAVTRALVDLSEDRGADDGGEQADDENHSHDLDQR